MLKRGRHGVIVRFDGSAQQAEEADDEAWASAAGSDLVFEELGPADLPLLAPPPAPPTSAAAASAVPVAVRGHTPRAKKAHVAASQESSLTSSLRHKVQSVRRKLAKEASERGEQIDESIPVDAAGRAEADDEDDDVAVKASKKKRKQEDLVNDLDMVAPDGFFERVAKSSNVSAFSHLNLSRALLGMLSTLRWNQPTPVQAQVIPYALQGRDVCASAPTGSGKTAAFVVPIVERLLHRARAESMGATRVLILLPTRELAAQCEAVVARLTLGTGITHTLCVGGASLKTQEAALRSRPDIVVATPGRVVDHLLNAPTWGLEDVEVLVLDECDRLLDLGFSDQVNTVLERVPKRRQTLLFSATLTEDVTRLAKLCLVRPVRIHVPARVILSQGAAESFAHLAAAQDRVPDTLRQEFVRVRPDAEPHLTAMALYLCCGALATSRTVLFVQSRGDAHKLCMLLTLSGQSCVELRGDMPHTHRAAALEEFKSGRARLLVATDLAARGLDVPAIDAVVNVHMPKTLRDYVHRVGRTARAGLSGRSISLITEADRPLLKALLKDHSGTTIHRRRLDQALVKAWADRIASWAPHVELIEEEEKMEDELRKGQMEIHRLENILKHSKEIMSRPKREWFQSEKEKQEARARYLREQLGTLEHDDLEHEQAFTEKMQSAKEKEEEVRQPKHEFEQKERKPQKSKREQQRAKKAVQTDEELAAMAAAKRAAKRKDKAEPALHTEQVEDVDDGDDLVRHFKDDEDEKRRKVWKQLMETPSNRGGVSRLLKAQAKRSKKEAQDRHKSKRPHKEDRKKGSFKSNSKYKRRK